jgi:hypothetical protein
MADVSHVAHGIAQRFRCSEQLFGFCTCAGLARDKKLRDDELARGSEAMRAVGDDGARGFPVAALRDGPKPGEAQQCILRVLPARLCIAARKAVRIASSPAQLDTDGPRSSPDVSPAPS